MMSAMSNREGTKMIYHTLLFSVELHSFIHSFINPVDQDNLLKQKDAVMFGEQGTDSLKKTIKSKLSHFQNTTTYLSAMILS
jgi:hypothetical protein